MILFIVNTRETVQFPAVGERFFFSPKRLIAALGPSQPPIQ